MFIRRALVASVLAVLGYASAACANSCSNVDIHGSFDESGLRENEYGVYAAGTFRVAGEADESKQPLFNLASINCEKNADTGGLECKLTQAVLCAQSSNPDVDNPNCSLDLSSSEYQMKELQRGVLTGMVTFGSTGCYETMLTIDRNAKRVYMSF